MSNILVTGATGFIGKHLISVLIEKGHSVVAPNSKQLNLSSDESIASYFNAYIPDHVIHLAGISSVVHDDVKQMYHVNGYTMHHLLETLKKKAFRGKFIYTSSANVYGGQGQRSILETDPFRPQNHYAASKVLGEAICNIYSDDLDIKIVRPFNCIGCGQKEFFLVPKLVKAFAGKDATIELGNVNVQRDFLDVRDAVNMYLAVLESSQEYDIFNFSNGKTFFIKKLIDMLSKISNHEIEVSVNEDFIRANDVTFQCGDNSRVKSIGYKQKYDIHDSLSWMYEFHSKG